MNEQGARVTRNWLELEGAVSDAEIAGVVGVSVIGPNGERWSHNGHRAFRTASVVKIPLMVEVYRRIDRGEHALDDTFTLSTDDKAPGSGVLLHLHDGIEMSLNDLIYLMMSISDNTATNMLIDLVGMEQVNETMRERGMTSSNLGRKMKGRPAISGEVENHGTPDDYATVLNAILNGTAASDGSCAAMVAMLEKQQNARRIARYLPEGDDIRWGSKTGSISGVTNDAGFVITPHGTVILAVFCEGFPDQHRGEQAIGDISRAALTCLGMLPPR